MAKTEFPAGFYFKEGTHAYYMDGVKMTGVTTVLAVISKGDALLNWAARMAVEFMEKAITSGEYDLTDKAVLGDLLDAAKSAHQKKKEEAGVAGTDTHALVEAYVQHTIENSGGWARSSIFHADTPDTPVKTFMKWSQDNNIRFLASEKRVYSKVWFVAGTYDMKFEMNGLTYIADVKTQKTIYDRTPFAQMAAYQYMEGEMGEPKVDGRIIIHMPRERAFNPDSDVYLSQHYEDDLKLFMAALEIYRNLNNRFEPLSAIKK